MSVSARFVAAYGRGWVATGIDHPYAVATGVSKRLTALWGSPLAARCSSLYSIVLGKRGTFYYGDLIPTAKRFEELYGEMPSVQKRVESWYSNATPVAKRIESWYGNVASAAKRLVASYESAALVSARRAFLYDDALLKKLRNVHAYADVAVTRQKLTAFYGDNSRVLDRRTFPYVSTAVIAKRHLAGWYLSTPASQRAVSNYDVVEVDFLKKRMNTGYALANAEVQSIYGTPTLILDGVVLESFTSSISCDENSSVWIASIELSKVENFSVVEIGYIVTVNFGTENFKMIVDGKVFRRESPSDLQMKVTTVSLLALADAPYAGTISVSYSEDTLASVVVSDMLLPFLGDVDSPPLISWELPDWVIPAHELVFTDVTPLAIAKRILEAIGGVLESNPNGSVRCRPKYVVNVHEYHAPLTVVDHIFYDNSVVSMQEEVSPNAGFNRVVVSNDTGYSQDAAADLLDEVPVIDEFGAEVSSERIIKAYLAVDRDVTLVHSGPQSTTIQPLGTVVRTEVETVEVKDGKASVSYKITSIGSIVFLDVNLGSYTFDDKEIIFATAGYTLATVTYNVTSVDWKVSSELVRDIQFLLTDV